MSTLAFLAAVSAMVLYAAASLAVTILIGIPTLGLRPTRRDWLGIAITTVGVVAVSMSAGPEHAVIPATWLRWAVAGALVLTLVASALWYRHGGMIVPGLEFIGAAGAAAAIVGCIVLALSPTQAEASG
ncbi:MAG: hypothetical protein Q4G46_02355 [Propionibacteriaceae bacterium]|nr:hypothetical protein [Propionibacteriaceae bacterium]